MMIHCMFPLLFDTSDLNNGLDTHSEEHRKRVAKSGRRCAFFEMLEGSSKPQPTRPTKSLSRFASQSLSKKKSADSTPIVDDEVSSDDMSELTAVTTAKSKRTTRASSVPTKTPGSRKSTRSAATSRSKAPVTPETDEDAEASGSEVGKRVSKSKKKGAKKAKDPIEVITELDEGGDLGGLEDAPPVQKPKRGRPPGKSKVAASKAKKPVDPTLNASQVEPTSDLLPSSSTRSRSKVVTDDEPEPVAHTKSRSQPKTKSSAKQLKVEEASHDTELMPPPKAPPKSKATKVSRTRPVEVDSDVEDIPVFEPQASEPMKHMKTASSHQHSQEQQDDSAPQADALSQAQAKGRKSSSTSDDAGYATAEQPMEVDDEHQRRERSKSRSISRREIPEKHQVEPSEEPSGPTVPVDGDVDMQDTTEPLRHSRSRQLPNAKAAPTISRQPSRSSSQTQVRVTSRTTGSLARPPSRLGTEVVDISSDDDDELDVLKTISADKPLSTSSTGSGTAPPTSIAPSSSSTFPPSKSFKQSPSIVSETIRRSTSNRSIGSSTTRVVETSATMLPTASPDIEMNTREQGMSDESHMKRPSAAKPKQNKAELEERLPNPSPPPSDTTSPPHSQVVAPSAQPLPSFDEEFAAEEAHHKDPAVEALTPFLSMVSASKLASLTEDEGDLTLEQYILRELERQYQQFKEDGDRQIALFKQRAAEARKVIEAL